MSEGKLPPAAQVVELLESVATHGVPSRGVAPILDVGTVEYVEFFREELVGDVAGGGASFCRFLEGPYGGGKTHVLQLLEFMAAETGLATVRIDLSQAMKIENWNQICKFIFSRMRLNLPGREIVSLPAILRALASEESVDSVRLKKARLPHSGFQSAMFYALDDRPPDDEQRNVLLDRYLLGDRVRVVDMRRHGLIGMKDPLSARNAEQVLSTVVGGLSAAGVPGTIFLFDENEQTFQGKSKRVQVAANLMRRLVDGSLDGRLRGAVAVFAVLPGFLSACSEIYPALGQRLAVPRPVEMTDPWRSPVLQVSSVSAIRSPEEFAERAVHKMLELAEHCGASKSTSTNLKESLSRASHRVLNENAGPGFRRPLMKALCTLTLRAVEEV